MQVGSNSAWQDFQGIEIGLNNNNANLFSILVNLSNLYFTKKRMIHNTRHLIMGWYDKLQC